MARITLKLSRGRKYTVDSLRSLELAFSADGKTYYAPTGIKLKQNQWDQRRQVVIKHPDSKKLTIDVNRKLLAAQDAMLRLSEGYSIDGMDARQLRDIVMDELNKSVVTRFILPYMEQFMETRPKPNTRSIYKATINKLIQFCPSMHTMVFDSINPGWLRQFNKWLGDNGCRAINARAIHMRNIRAVFNAAIDDGLTTNYPFRKHKIPHEVPGGHSLSVIQLRQLMELQLDGQQGDARDCFILSFCLIGINMADLWCLTDPTKGIVSYYRQKTGKLYEFKLPPEAAALWPVMMWVRKYQHPHSLVCMINRLLKPVGALIGCHKLTTYYARRSWATIAAALDIPKETIAEALGHTKPTVTDAYITFDHSKVDRANRAVLDFVFNYE